MNALQNVLMIEIRVFMVSWKSPIKIILFFKNVHATVDAQMVVMAVIMLHVIAQ